jgi:hypothetical protein
MSCKVCDGPVAQEINQLRGAGWKLRELAAKCGIPKPTLSRHFIRCLKEQAVETNRDRSKFDRHKTRLWVKDLDGQTRLLADVVPYPRWQLRRPLREDEIVNVRCCVEFEPLPTVFRNPAAIYESKAQEFCESLGLPTRDQLEEKPEPVGELGTPDAKTVSYETNIEPETPLPTGTEPKVAPSYMDDLSRRIRSMLGRFG